MSREYRDKSRAVFLAIVMLVSVVGASVAFTGAAAAAGNESTVTQANSGPTYVDAGAGNVAVQEITVTAGNAGSTTISSFTVENDGTATDSDVDQISVYGESAGKVGSNESGFGNVDADVEIATDESQTFTVTADIASEPTDGYTIQTNTTVNSDSEYSYDGVATANSPTEIDVAPEISDATTADSDGNGQIDQIQVTFSENVSISDGDSGDGFPGVSIQNYEIGNADYAVDDTGSVTIDLVEESSPDTDVTPEVTYAAGSDDIVDADQQDKEHTDQTFSSTTDGAAPSITQVSLSESNEELDLSFNSSEPITEQDSDIQVTVDSPNSENQYQFDGSDFSESAENNDGTYGYELTTTQAYDDGTGTYTASVDDAIDATDNNGGNNAEDVSGLTDDVTVDTLASISASPDGTEQSANHTVTWTLGSQTDVQTYEIDYDTGSGANGADISNVGPEDIVQFGVDLNEDGEISGDDLDFTSSDSNAGGVNQVSGADGTVLTVDTSSSTTIDSGNQIILEYNDTVNPSENTDVALRLDPDTPDVDVTRTLSVGSTSAPTVASDGVSINETSISEGGVYGENVNGTDQTLAITFDKKMDTSVDPTASLTVGGEDVSINEGSWSEDSKTWSGTVDINVSNAEVDATTTVSDATGTNGNSLANEDTRTFEIDTASLGIDSATTDESSDGSVDRIDVTLNDTYSSAETDDFSVTDDDNDGVTVNGINANSDSDPTTLELELSSALTANATPNATLETGGSITDDAGNGVESAQTIEAADGVAPTVSSFDLVQKDGRTLNVSLDSDEQLDSFTVTINDTEGDGINDDDPAVVTLNESDFNESVSSGTYNYTTNYTVSADGTYFGSIESAADAAGNDDVDQTTETVQIDQTGPSITPDSPTNNAIVTSQEDITATITDDGGVGVNSGDIYVTLEDSTGELIDRGRVDATNGVTYSDGTLKIASTGDAPAYAEGDVDVTVEATDTNGEQTTESWNFTYTTVTVEEFTADGNTVSVNVSTATSFDTVNATIQSSQSLADEDGVISETITLTADGDYYTGTFTAPRDGEYNLNTVEVANAEGETATPGLGSNTATVNTTQPYLTDATISSYDGSSTDITVQFNEPLAGSINDGDADSETETLSVEGEDVTGTTSDLESGQVTLTVSNAVQTGDEPNVSVNTAADITERSGSGTVQADSKTTIHTTQLSLSEGTNFVSIPEATANTVDLTQYDTQPIDVVWTYEDGSWQSYDPAKSDANNDFTALEGGQGYVFEMDQSATMDVNAYNVVGGDSQDTATPGQQELSEGWNLVGHWQEGKQTQTNALSTLDNRATDTAVYTQSGSGYTYTAHSGDLKPGESYWVFVTDDDVYGESTTFTQDE
ncbi:surface glycoprotein [Halopenitus persicus]|uniref:surface glycoprotein n=1 Tax=Halopenitus persicus TaxID=1048396 RepID=UPI000BBB043A|nr:surface glycoprotein [Halopenitus persicus]